MEFFKKHWVKGVIIVVIIYVAYKYFVKRGAVMKVAGHTSPGDTTGGVGGANQS